MDRTNQDRIAATSQPLPEHHDLHVGPYGVEMPDSSLFVTVTEVTAVMEKAPETTKLDENISKSPSA
jgi:hypothetical protein